jgi:hypothetical protein
MLTHIIFIESTDPKILHGPAVDNLLKTNSGVQGYKYDVCVRSCKLYNDDAEECEFCKEKRFEETVAETIPKSPVATIKILSVGDVIAQFFFFCMKCNLLIFKNMW